MSQKCKICLQIKQPLHNIIGNKILHDIYNICTPSKLCENLSKNDSICMQCMELLHSSYNYRTLCLDAIKSASNKIKAEALTNEDEDKASVSKSTKRKVLILSKQISKKIKSEEELIQQNVDEISDSTAVEHVEETIENIMKELEDPVPGELGEEEVVHLHASENNEFIQEEWLEASTSSDNDKKLQRLNKCLGKTTLEGTGYFKATLLEGFRRNANGLTEADGFLYVVNGMKNNKRYMKCASHPGCKGRGQIIINDDGTFADNLFCRTPHNHPRDSKLITKLHFLHDMRQASSTESTPTKQIYDRLVEKYPGIEDIVPYKCVMGTMKRIQHEVTPNNITTITDFTRTLEAAKSNRFITTRNGNKFYQKTLKNSDGSQAVIFTDVKFNETLGKVQEIFVDTAFKIVMKDDSDFYILTVTATVNENRFPFFYAILDSKSLECYTNIFILLRDIYAPDMKPAEIITDYEEKLQLAIRSVYRDSYVSGSYFYYVLNIYKYICDLGLWKYFEEQPSLKKIYDCLLTLPLFPITAVQNAFSHIQCDAAENNELLEDIFEYVDKTWMQQINPQIFCLHRLRHRVNEAIIFPFQKLRDLLSANQNTLFILTEKLILLDAWSKQNHGKIMEGKRISVNTIVKYNRVLDKAWDDIESNPNNFKQFFDSVAPLVSKIEGQIWVWGYYNYKGPNDETLISFQDMEEVYELVEYDEGDEKENPQIQENEAVETEETDDDENNKMIIMNEDNEAYVTLDELQGGTVIYVETVD